MYIINLFGAPSSGKSTIASGLFFLMKIHGLSVEMTTEFAKEIVLERRPSLFSEQDYIFAEQLHRLKTIEKAGYDFVIVDSPLLLSVFYNTQITNPYFSPYIFHEFYSFDNFNFYLEREHSFEVKGRRHTEEESQYIHHQLQNFLEHHSVPFTKLTANPVTPYLILQEIAQRLPQFNITVTPYK